MKKSSKLLWIALVVVASLVVMAFSAMASEPAYAESGVANKAYAAADVTMYYDAETESLPEELLHDAIIASEEDGGKVVDVILEADMVFANDATIGTPGATHCGQVNVYSVTENGAAPTLGITVNKTVRLNVYGNVNFNNITLLKESSSTSFSEGGNFNFSEGLGSFGHDETTEGAKDWGTLVCGTTSATKLHLSGNLAIYTGAYWDVTGNFYNTGATNNNVTITLAGNAETQDFYAGKHNAKANEILGTTTVQILDDAKVTSMFVGGNRNTGGTVGIPAANITINTTGEIKATYLGNYVNAQDSTYNNHLIKYTIINGNFTGSIYGHRSTAGTAKNINLDVEFRGGNFAGAVFLGVTATQGENSIGINGNINVTFNGGTFTNNVYLGGYNHWSGTTKPENDHYVSDSANRTITINDGVTLNNLYGHYINKAKDGQSHRISGDMTVNFNGGTINGVVNAVGLMDSAAVTFKNGDKVAKFTINVNDGFTFNNAHKYSNNKVSTYTHFHAGPLVNAANADFNGEIEFNLNGGNFPARATSTDTYYVFAGSDLNGSAAKHSGKITVNISGGTVACNGLYGGSNVRNTGAEHSGEIVATLTGVNSTPGFWASSYLRASNAIHSGNTTLYVQGTEGKTITLGNHLSASSYLSSTNNLHSGEAKMYFRDIYTHTVSELGITKNFAISGGYIFAGSQISLGSQTGASELIFQRCYFVTTTRVFGGGRLDGMNTEFKGTSKITVDANTTLVYNEETEKYEEQTGTGWNYIQAEIIGGSYLNGYNSTDANTSYANQSGASEVVVIGPETAGDDIKSRLTFVSSAPTGTALKTSYSIFGGSYYGATRLKTAPTGLSSVTLKNVIHYEGAAPDVFGGHFFNIASQFTATDVIPTTRVIIETAYAGKVIGGHFSAITSDGSSRTYNIHSAVILKPGAELTNTVILGSMANGAGVTLSNTNGTSVLEIYSGAIADNDMIDLQFQKGTDGKTGVKFIGAFNDTNDSDTSFTVYIKTKVDLFDIVQATGSTLDLRLYTVEEGVDTPSTASGRSNSVERMVNNKFVNFVDSTSTRYKYNEILVDPSMTFADLLATEGLKIHTNYTTYMTGTDYDYVNNYADIIAFDASSLSPNGYKFYAVNEDGTIGEELTNIPEDPSVQIIVQSGNRYSAPSTLYHVLGATKKSVELASNLTMNYKIDKAAAEAAGYTVEYITVNFCGITDTIYPEAELDAEGRYVFKFKNIAPSGISDAMTVTVHGKYNGEDVSSVPTVYGVEEYLYNLFKIAKNEGDDELKTLIADLLNYGAAAQNYIGWNNDDAKDLANAKLIKDKNTGAATTDVGTLNNIRNANHVEIANPTATMATTVVLANSIQVRYRLTLPEDITNVTLKVSVGGVESTVGTENLVATGKANEYYFYVDTLNADQVSDEILVTVYDGETAISNTYRYSVESYAALAAETTQAEYESLRTLTDAMIKYGKAAAAYAASLTA